MNNSLRTRFGGACTNLCLGIALMIGAVIYVDHEATAVPVIQRIRGGSISSTHHEWRSIHNDNVTAGEMPGPLLFDRSTGWNGTTSEDSVSFCQTRGSARSLCPWKAYCPGSSGPLGGLLRKNDGEASETYAPIATASGAQPVLVSLSSCRQIGNPSDISRANVEYVMCCRDGEEGVGASIGTDAKSLTWYDSECREECHISDDDDHSSTITQRYCLLACRSMHHNKTLADEAQFFATLPNHHVDLVNEHSECLGRCQTMNLTEGSSILPSSSRRYCTTRCRWVYRQKAISRLASIQQNPHESSSSIASERCDDLSDNLHHDGLCTSVSHRQKPRVNLILSSNNDWLRKEYESGLRDCAASECHVMAGIGHTNSSHLFVGTDSPSETTKNAWHIHVLVTKKERGVKQENVDIAWNASSHHRDLKQSWIPYSRQLLMCDLCDKYAEEVLPNSERSWDRSLDATPRKPCIVDLFKRHTIPGPESLPLINPVLGFDAIFVTNYTPLKDRKKAMIKRVGDQFGIQPIFISDFDRQVLSDEDMKCFGDAEGQQAYVGHKIAPGEYSLTLKHYSVYYYMVEHSLDNVIIMEDDGSFDYSDWLGSDSLWQEYISTVPPDYDILILCGVPGTFMKGQKITEHMFLGQHSRALDMYLVSQKGARNMLRSLPAVANIDVHMNYAAGSAGAAVAKMPGKETRTIDMKIYHVEPPMSEQLLPDGTHQNNSTYWDKKAPK